MATPDDTEVGIVTWPESKLPPEASPVLNALGNGAPLPQDLAGTVEAALGSETGISAKFIDLETGESLYENEAEAFLAPASSLKVLTASTALAELGPDYRIETSVVSGGSDDSVVLVGAGDITLSRDGDGFYPGSGSLQDLADQVLKARDGKAPKTVVVDDSIYKGATQAAGADPVDYKSYSANMGSIMVDGGRKEAGVYAPRHDDPVMNAADEFAALVGASDVSKGRASTEAETLGTVESATVYEMTELLVRISDNTLADAMAMQVGLHQKGEMTWDSAIVALNEHMKDLGIDPEGTVIRDGSGLSAEDSFSAAKFTQLLHLASQDPRQRMVLQTLPVAGLDGTVEDRFDGLPEAYGVARAKTGTLDIANSLTGTVVTEDGRLLGFSMIENHFESRDTSRETMDKVVAAVAECGC
ncbi:D-alanyl-D-alanine carboxypeptidase/D-alanyl-D-alanine endopeptidase [Salininema proteolyticum]|uniref:D-alanyl-D-alanine carboxypeptidase/D-alanyl-D-alanine-endopeptidase n=1 Tax=Salininema proteolyticum TaxID=1607685 RepID=A0ABV8U530_9ACTN